MMRDAQTAAKWMAYGHSCNVAEDARASRSARRKFFLNFTTVRFREKLACFSTKTYERSRRYTWRGSTSRMYGQVDTSLCRSGILPCLPARTFVGMEFRNFS